VRLYATAERALLGEAIGGPLPELEAKREAAMAAAREEVDARRASCERCSPPFVDSEMRCDSLGSLSPLYKPLPIVHNLAGACRGRFTRQLRSAAQDGRWGEITRGVESAREELGKVRGEQLCHAAFVPNTTRHMELLEWARAREAELVALAAQARAQESARVAEVASAVRALIRSAYAWLDAADFAKALHELGEARPFPTTRPATPAWPPLFPPAPPPSERTGRGPRRAQYKPDAARLTGACRGAQVRKLAMKERHLPAAVHEEIAQLTKDNTRRHQEHMAVVREATQLEAGGADVASGSTSPVAASAAAPAAPQGRGRVSFHALCEQVLAAPPLLYRGCF